MFPNKGSSILVINPIPVAKAIQLELYCIWSHRMVLLVFVDGFRCVLPIQVRLSCPYSKPLWHWQLWLPGRFTHWAWLPQKLRPSAHSSTSKRNRIKRHINFRNSAIYLFCKCNFSCLLLGLYSFTLLRDKLTDASTSRQVVGDIQKIIASI